jgi:undecaprenyl diphosphate synthase|tara:strand:- start:3726 stop:4487 length:762 start_codon:yes stop_codon:yes gene_type:complete
MKFTLRKNNTDAAASDSNLAKLKIPEHLAIIMDGNGRWAKNRGLPRVAGHRAGADSVRSIVESCDTLGVRFLTLYAFSSENWNRPQKEVDALMELLERFLKEKTPEMMEDNVRLTAIGRLDKLPSYVRVELDKAIATTASNSGVTMNLALSYGGREEIVDAAKKLMRKVSAGEIAIDDVDNDVFSAQMYTADIPDPCLLIRTSGEVRLSNFLLWQLSYAEIVITDKLWPDFGHDALIDALKEYTKRDRRFGKI